ncbi:exonuclease V subunit alpha [Corynebacterium kalinowskii]|uniref:Exonuclease V subunit alpha n=1 Tax=Corynebacterium kalinowskii TaxID=2675216 RepID=A0A6B8VND0_9CORY|nr:AAA domain-containing protein [Corynebacterium kalinowskii]QGU01037.1 exonuclease V subunit alpha [Corynebacterium kalinowskii]
MDSKLEHLINYFTESARISGLTKSKEEDAPFEQSPYSVLWYYEHFLKQDLAWNNGPNLLRAFLTGQGLPPPAEDIVSQRNQLLDELRQEQSVIFGSERMLNDSQLTAVANATHFPVSFVQGPPGTGKTLTISRIAAFVANQNKTVAIVSSNNTAISNVLEVLERADDLATSSQVLSGISARVAKLGHSGIRRELELPRKDGDGMWKFSTDSSIEYRAGSLGTLGSGQYRKGWEASVSHDDFLADYPIVLSTLHSIKKCFADGADPDKKFDLVIMDESSQTNSMLGILALSCAKSIVLVGDENQLPPIVSEAIPDVSYPVFDMKQPNHSFLTACYEIFGAAQITPDRTFLNEHYRCHPGIINFCNTEIYRNQLDIRTDTSGFCSEGAEIPIRVTCYQGDYRESEFHKDFEQLTADDPVYSSAVNRKQMAILRHDLMPDIRRHLEAGRTICFLTPFRKQMDHLAAIINEETQSVTRISDLPAEGSFTQLTVSPKSLTVHRSQGQEFDVVYLLPVEDGSWRWPWSQGRNLVNVAVSRAKQELHVVVSTKLMETATQLALYGESHEPMIPVALADDPGKQHLYIRRLVEYVHFGIQGRHQKYGIKPTNIESVFDQRYRFQLKNESLQSAGELAVVDYLENLRDQAVLQHVPLHSLEIDGTPILELFEDDADSQLLIRSGHIDIAIVDIYSRQLLLAIEIDGAYHRFNSNLDELRIQKRNDRMKDQILTDIGMQVLHGNRLNGELANRKPVLLRLPDDGSTFWETDRLHRSARANFCEKYSGDSRRPCDCVGLRSCLVDQHVTLDSLIESSTVGALDIRITIPTQLPDPGSRPPLLATIASMFPFLLRPAVLTLGSFMSPSGEARSLTKFLKKWEEDDPTSYQEIIGTRNVREITTILVEQEVLENSPNGKLPTNYGYSIGLVVLKGKNTNGSFSYAGYPSALEKTLRQEISELIRLNQK